jgi:hypothetical protein
MFQRHLIIPFGDEESPISRGKITERRRLPGMPGLAMVLPGPVLLVKCPDEVVPDPSRFQLTARYACGAHSPERSGP